MRAAREQAKEFVRQGEGEEHNSRYVLASTAFIAAGGIYERMHELEEAERCYRSAATALDRAADKVAMAHERQERAP